ncbi:hypothetical protein [Photobacterium sp. 1_MG-2023]|uniref:hypothetical protein n=1 Tax=Photobacterium sp. 1_MG-2023 TaxID=3062646 RepID=UPI0026E441F6|nr:hypothetical protein [Photobacterium sp. 1_MG-2023]MDO6705412.1 hypothetical protein [Photobacterium sp. 1_MG-2023]
MFKKKLSVVMLASLGLFGCDWNDDDKKAVEEAVKESVTEEVVQPEGLNIQVELYNQVPALLTDDQKLEVSFSFDIDNSGTYEESEDFRMRVLFTNGEPSISFGEGFGSIKDKYSTLGYKFKVDSFGTARIERLNGKTVINVNVLPEPELAKKSESDTEVSIGMESGRPDPVLSGYLDKIEKAKASSLFNLGVGYNSDKLGEKNEDYLSDSGGTGFIQLSSNDISDSKDDYKGGFNYSDIERVTISFD